MMSTNKMGCKELLMQRMFLAIASSIAVQFFFVSCLILITNLNADYTSWIQDTWTTVTSFRMWSHFFILATITFLQGLTCSKSYLSPPPYVKSRFAKLCGIFTSQNIVLGALYITIGSVLVWLHLSLKSGKYSSMTTNCSIVYGTCLVEEHYFLLLSGPWSGLYFFMKTNIFHVKYLRFPIISLSKFFRLKRGISSMLPSLMITSLWPTLYYFIGYYILGSYFRSMMLFLASAHLETEPLDSIQRLMSFSLALHLWLYQLIFILTINSMYLLFEVYLTQWVYFDFKHNNVYNNDNAAVTLPEALAMDKIPIMQHLGYLDLMILAQKDKARRSILFTLSQPGGHPYNWNCIVEKCIDLIKKFSDDVNATILQIQEPSFTTGNVPPVAAGSFQREHVYHMRSLVTESKPMCIREDMTAKPVTSNEQFLNKFVKTKWQNFLSYLLSKPLIHYVFGEQAGSKVRYTLFNGQPVIWAAEALSSLCILSLSEDSYGIVQKDLALIINTLLGLKQALDKLHKSNILAKKQRGDDMYIKQILTALRAATRRSIYRIITSFEMYIGDLALEPASTEHLQNFINYRE